MMYYKVYCLIHNADILMHALHWVTKDILSIGFVVSEKKKILERTLANMRISGKNQHFCRSLIALMT